MVFYYGEETSSQQNANSCTCCGQLLLFGFSVSVSSLTKEKISTMAVSYLLVTALYPRCGSIEMEHGFNYKDMVWNWNTQAEYVQGRAGPAVPAVFRSPRGLCLQCWASRCSALQYASPTREQTTQKLLRLPHPGRPIPWALGTSCSSFVLLSLAQKFTTSQRRKFCTRLTKMKLMWFLLLGF